MLSSHNHYITEFLRETYPDHFVTFKIVAYSGDISVFVIHFDKEQQLDKEWNKISGNIAGYYQAELQEPFSKWNIYLFYLCKEVVSLSLKYKIENDRFSSRKVVIDGYDNEVTDLAINDIIQEHVTNRDISYFPKNKQGRVNFSTISNSSVIWEVIKDITLKPGKGNSAETEKVLLKIESKIRNENQQG